MTAEELASPVASMPGKWSRRTLAYDGLISLILSMTEHAACAEVEHARKATHTDTISRKFIFSAGLFEKPNIPRQDQNE